MIIKVISDTHLMHKELDEELSSGGDIIIHCGDALNNGSSLDAYKFLEWFKDVPFKHKIYTPGNHDIFFEENAEEGRVLCESRGITLLKDRLIDIEDIKIYGCPWTPIFYDWAFMGDDVMRKEYWEKVTEPCDIIVSHGPPKGILDLTRHQHVGCQYLTEACYRLKPKYVLFGHIHTCGGMSHDENGTTYYNCANANDFYNIVNPVRTILYEK